MSTTEQERAWKGASVLEQFLVPISDLRETEGNPRMGNVEEIMLSLKRFGQVRPVAVRNDGVTIVAGHHVTKAANRLGWTHVACIPGDFADESEAIAYLLADNQLAAIGEIDDPAFVQMTLPYAETGQLQGTGISMDYFEDVMGRTSAVILEAEETINAGLSSMENDEAAAQRAAMIAAYQQKKEVVMLMTLEEYEKFGVHFRILRQEYGTDGVKETILHALELEAYRLNQGEPMVVVEEAEEAPEA